MSLVTFGVTVIGVRFFLQLTGFPQIGNSVLHIAHALWGGLLLFVAVLLPLAFANRWAIEASALLSGIGIGLFIDEVGKFITQTNDYFFPPALPFIYGFFLLTVLVYLYFRRSRQEEDPRRAMYHALAGLQDVLDGDLDTAEAARIHTQLAVARENGSKEIVSLAKAISSYLEQEKRQIVPAKAGYWNHTTRRMDVFAARVGRRRHHVVISAILILWTLVAIGFVVILILDPPSLENQVVQWRGALIAIQALVGVLLVAADAAWFSGRESLGLRFAIVGTLLSLVALQTIYFYLSQFQAITATLLQLLFLLTLLDYRNRYVSDRHKVNDELD
jgi:hypothetical protein